MHQFLRDVDLLVRSRRVAGEMGRTRPLSRTRAEDIARLRAWAADRTVSAG